jgi:predicted ArsR family transcriptional regulator
MLDGMLLDAIAEPARLAMVRHLAEHGSASLTELADAAGVHVNTARTHVAALQDAGVLDSAAREAAGPGRPAIDFRLRPGVTLGATDFRGLAELLAARLAQNESSKEDLRAFGGEWGRYLVGRPGERDLERELPVALEQLGFQAEVGDGTIRLRACPCPVVSPGRPELVCALAEGVIDGVLAAAGGRLRAREFVHDPSVRRCGATLVRVLPDE